MRCLRICSWFLVEKIEEAKTNNQSLARQSGSGGRHFERFLLDTAAAVEADPISHNCKLGQINGTSCTVIRRALKDLGLASYSRRHRHVLPKGRTKHLRVDKGGGHEIPHENCSRFHHFSLTEKGEIPLPPSRPCCLLSAVVSKRAVKTLNFCTQPCVSQSQWPIWDGHSALEIATAAKWNRVHPKEITHARTAHSAWSMRGCRRGSGRRCGLIGGGKLRKRLERLSDGCDCLRHTSEGEKYFCVHTYTCLQKYLNTRQRDENVVMSCVFGSIFNSFDHSRGTPPLQTSPLRLRHHPPAEWTVFTSLESWSLSSWTNLLHFQRNCIQKAALAILSMQLACLLYKIESCKAPLTLFGRGFRMSYMTGGPFRYNTQIFFTKAESENTEMENIDDRQ